MTKASFVCDRCGVTWEIINGKIPEGKQRWTLEVGLFSEAESGRSYRTSSGRRSAEWCRSCVEQAGFLAYADKTVVPAPTPPTIEDLIKDIVEAAVIEHQR